MPANRIIIVILALTILCAAYSLAGSAGSSDGQPPAATSGSGPSLGAWQFTGKDSAGVVWTGALTIEKLDPNRFDTNKYHFMCNLEVRSASSENGVGAPGRYDPTVRALSFSTGKSQITSYTAVLSPDGKSLTHGKWTVSKQDNKKGGQAGMTIVSSGTWPAKLIARP